MNHCLKNKQTRIFLLLSMMSSSNLLAAASSLGAAPSPSYMSTSKEPKLPAILRGIDKSPIDVLHVPGGKIKPQRNLARIFEERFTGKIPYYSKGNLNRINRINAERLSQRDETGNLLQPLIKKHAPLVIFSDPTGMEVGCALKIFLHDIAYASFHPVLLVSRSLLLHFKENENPTYQFTITAFQNLYQLYDIPDSQFVIFIPPWFTESYVNDHGLRRDLFENKTDLLADAEEFNTWITAQESTQHLSYQESHERRLNRVSSFIADLEKVFVTTATPDQPIPTWDIYVEAHGIGRTAHSPAIIGGLPESNFLQFLNFFSEHVNTGIIYVQSCYIGGANSNWLNEQINMLKKPLSFHLMLAALGDFETFSSKCNEENPEKDFRVKFDPKKPILDSAFMRFLESYFQDAAQIESTTKIDPTALDNLLFGATTIVSIAENSLHGSEYFPQFKLKGSSRFVTIKNDPRFFIIDNTTDVSQIVVPHSAHTILCYEQSIENLRLNIYTKKLTDRTCEGHNALLAYRGPSLIPNWKFPTSFFPTFIVTSQHQTIEQENKLSIAHVQLDSSQPNMGIYAFFRDAFLTTQANKNLHVEIEKITGIDDISAICQTQKNSNSSEQKVLLRVLDQERQKSIDQNTIAMTNVIISKKSNAVTVTFQINSLPFSMKFYNNIFQGYTMDTTDFIDAFTKNNVQRLEQFLELGCNPNQQLSDGRTLLTEALHNKNLTQILMLLKYGADPALKDNAQPSLSPLDIARRASAGSFEKGVLQLLMHAYKEKAPHDIALMKAIQANDLPAAEQALDAGADINHVSPYTNATPLEQAVLVSKSSALVKLLLNRGASPYDQNRQPLIFAIISDPNAEMYSDAVKEIITALRGMINFTNNIGETPLMRVCKENKNLWLMPFLLEIGADPYFEDYGKNTAMKHLQQNNATASIEMLIDWISQNPPNPYSHEAFKYAPEYRKIY